MTGRSAGLAALWREKLELSRQERVELAKRWLDRLERLIGHDSSVVRVDREDRESP